MSTPFIVGQAVDVIMLDKVGGKRTGQTRRGEVLDLKYHWKPKGVVRSVLVATTDGNPVRVSWVEPKYLTAVRG